MEIGYPCYSAKHEQVVILFFHGFLNIKNYENEELAGCIQCCKKQAVKCKEVHALKGFVARGGKAKYEMMGDVIHLARGTFARQKSAVIQDPNIIMIPINDIFILQMSIGVYIVQNISIYK